MRLTRRASAISLALVLASCGGGEDGPELATIQVTPNPVAIAQQQTAQLQASVLNDDGQLVSGIPITFSTANEQVASVSNTGLVTGSHAGATTITVKAQDLETEVPVTVTAVSNAITLSPNPGVVPQNGTLQLTAVVTDVAGQVVPNAPVTFTSGSLALATVSASGLVDPVGPAGLVVITATSGTLTTTAQVAITQVPATVVVTPSEVTMEKSSQVLLSASLRDIAGAPISGSAFTYSSSNPGLATVSATGVIQGLGTAGTLQVTVSSGALSTQVPVTLIEVTSPAGVLDHTSPTPSGMLTYGVSVSASGSILVVGTDGSGSTATMATATMLNRTFTSLPVSGGFATDVAFMPSGTTAWLANIPGASASEINAATGQVLGSAQGVTATDAMFRLNIGSLGNRVFLAGAGNFYEIDPATRAVVRTVATGNSGFTLTYNPARAKFFTAGGGVAEVDPATGAVRVLPIAAGNVAVSEDGTKLFAVIESPDLFVYDAVTNAFITSYPLPCAAWGIAMTLDGEKLIATCSQSGQVLFIDPTTGGVTANIATAGQPRRIGFTPDGRMALITDNSGFVHFIR